MAHIPRAAKHPDGMCMVYREICRADKTPGPCVDVDILGVLPRGRHVPGKDPRLRLCPAHSDDAAKLSINPGTEGQRVVWRCLKECDPHDIRRGLLSYGIDPSCLGNYGLAPGSSGSGARVDPAMLANSNRWLAARKLPPNLNAKLYLMCLQAIEDGDGDLIGDPYRLLPTNKDDFIALARRAGVDPKYAYRVYRQWLDEKIFIGHRGTDAA